MTAAEWARAVEEAILRGAAIHYEVFHALLAHEAEVLEEGRAALTRFGKHDNNCLVVIRWNEPDAKCDCGLQVALGTTGGTEE